MNPIKVVEAIKETGNNTVPMPIVDELIAMLNEVNSRLSYALADRIMVEKILIENIPTSGFGNFPRQTAEFAAKEYNRVVEENEKLKKELDLRNKTM